MGLSPVVVRIIGGLGNQLFQYAAGLALADRLGVPLRADLRWMRRYERRPYLLDKLSTPPAEIGLEERIRHTWFPFRRNPPFLYIKLIRHLNHRIFMERSLAYEPAFEHLGAGTFLWGYFQTERYFPGAATTVRKTLTGSADRSLYDPAVLAAIDDEGSVAVQYRRGDYVTHVPTNHLIGTCSPEFYRAAIGHVRSQIRQPRFVIFSDDIPWCRENAGIDGAVYVERSGGTPVDDLHLAASCRHIVLANSTFSWWCAWLNQNPGMLAIAPARWFASQELHEASRDLIPARWTRL